MKARYRLIASAEQSIYHQFPGVLSIDIKVSRLAQRRYSSSIMLRTRHTAFFVDKEDESYEKSLEKCLHAIKKRLEKVKVNRIHSINPEMTFEDNSIESKVA